METKKSRVQSGADKERLHKIRSENARKEKRDERGRFTASNKNQKKAQSNNKMEGKIDIIIVDDGCGCDCM